VSLEILGAGRKSLAPIGIVPPNIYTVFGLVGYNATERKKKKRTEIVINYICSK